MATFKGKEYKCPLEAIVDMVGGKWKASILWHLNEDSKRFGKLRKLLPGISPKVLTEQLRELEEDKLITRESYPELPPKVVYSMSDFGTSIWPILYSMEEWGTDYLQSIKE